MISQLRHAYDRRWVISVFAAVISLWTASSPAAPINYGDFGPDPPGVTMYLQVTESSGTDPIPPGRFGEPDLNGNVLDFDPTEFVASATGVDADITDVQLNFTLMSVPGAGITSMLFSESGDFTLFGGGSALTQVAAGLTVQVDILAVDGTPLAVPLSDTFTTVFLADLDSDGPVVGAPWANSLLIDFEAILNEGLPFPFDLGVTKAEVVLDDPLIAISEEGTIATIAKKDFKIGTSEIVPEPTSLAMMICAIATYGFALRRRILGSIRKRLG